MAAKIFRINYKSDFILTLNSDAGWLTPFCIKFWTGAPSQAYYVGWDGETYTHCSYDPSEPTKLLVQFDDHHLPIGDLKFQIAYHFTVADFPNDTEDEVINPASITTEIDGETYQVMLDFTGETAPEIEFSLPAYANEAQRIANEQQRIANEEQRIANEQQRIAAETIRQQNEAQRIAQESARVDEFARLKRESESATQVATDAAALANQKAQYAQEKATLADSAATLANQKAQLAADKAALAASAAQLANDKAALANDAATLANQKAQLAADKAALANEMAIEASRVNATVNGTTLTVTDRNGQSTSVDTKGDKGDTGDAATIQVGTTTTGQPGTDAVVTNSGTSHAAVLNFTIPQGEKGDTGEVSEAELEAAIEPLARKDGYYSRMAVGFAENLVNTQGSGSEQVFTFRTSCGTSSLPDVSSALFQQLRGNSIVWNQIMVISSTTDVTTNNVTFHPNGNSITISTGEGGASGAAYYNMQVAAGKISVISGHKYFVYLNNTEISGLSWTEGYMDSELKTNSKDIKTCTNTCENIYRLTVASGTSFANPITVTPMLIDLTLMFGVGNEPSTVAEFEALYKGYFPYNGGTIINNAVTAYETTGFNQWDEEWELGVIDITNGENSPSTTQIRAKNYCRCLPNADYYGFMTSISPKNGYIIWYDENFNHCGYDGYAYHYAIGNGGHILHSPSNAAFFRLYCNVQYGTTYNNDICINLSWSGYRNGEYEPYKKNTLPINITTLTGKLNGEGESVVVAPDGLRGAGTAYDYGVVENGYLTKIVKVMGSVDLGTLTWTYTSGENSRLEASLSGIKLASADNITGNLLCEKYVASSVNWVYNHTREKIIAVHNSAQTIWVYDSAYTDATTFTTAMNGVELIYELATPLTYVLDEPIPMIAPVADFGTEYAAPTEEVDTNGVPKSAPFRSVINYSPDFTQDLVNLPKNYDTIGGIDALCSQLASTLSTALNGTFTITRGAYDEATKKYAWNVSFTPST